MGGLQSIIESWEAHEEIEQHVQPLSMIIVSDGVCQDANGVYALISEEMGGRPVWANLGKPSYRIQWLVHIKTWVLQLVEQDPLYCILDSADYTFPSNPRWRHWSNANGPLPSISYQPLTNVNVFGAGTPHVNGVYIPCPLTQGGRPVWAQVGNDDCKIMWDGKLSTWLLDYNGKSPYAMNACKDKTFPRGPASWSSHMGGQAPMPNSQCTLRSNIIVKGAGSPGVDGLYVPCRDAHGGRSVWTKLDSDDYRIRWSKTFDVWIIEYHQSTALYRIDNCGECTPPITAKWECFQGGSQPTPTIEYQAFCNIIISKASIDEVNGVYNPVDEAVGGLPVWVKLGIPEFRIQWSSEAAAWVLRDTKGQALYSSEDVQYIRTDDPGQLTPKSAQWVRCKSAEELAEEEEDEDGLASCLGRSSTKAKKASEGQHAPVHSARISPPQGGAEQKEDAHDDDFKKKGQVAAPARDATDVRKKRHVEAVSPLPAVEEAASPTERSYREPTPASSGTAGRSPRRKDEGVPPLLKISGGAVPGANRDDQQVRSPRKKDEEKASATTSPRKSTTPTGSPQQGARDVQKKPNIPPLRMPASETFVVQTLESSKKGNGSSRFQGSDTSASLPVTPGASDMPKIMAPQVRSPASGSSDAAAPDAAKKASKVLSAKVVGTAQATPKGSSKQAQTLVVASTVLSPVMSPVVPRQTPNTSGTHDSLSYTDPQAVAAPTAVVPQGMPPNLQMNLSQPQAPQIVSPVHQSQAPQIVSPVHQSQAPQIMSPLLSHQPQTGKLITQDSFRQSASPLGSPVSSLTVKPGLSNPKTDVQSGSLTTSMRTLSQAAAYGSLAVAGRLKSSSSALGQSTPTGSLPPSKSPSVAGSFVGSPALPLAPGNQLIGSQRRRSTSIPPVQATMANKQATSPTSASAAYDAYRASQGLVGMPTTTGSLTLSRPQSVNNLQMATPQQLQR